MHRENVEDFAKDNKKCDGVYFSVIVMTLGA